MKPRTRHTAGALLALLLAFTATAAASLALLLSTRHKGETARVSNADR